MKAVLTASLFAVSMSVSTPALGQKISEFPVHNTAGYPYGITADRYYGLLVYTQFLGNAIGFMRTDGTLATLRDDHGMGVLEYPLPNPSSAPSYISQGGDGSVWFTMALVNRIGRWGLGDDFSDGPVGVPYKEYTVPTAGVQPYEISGGRDGDAYATEFAGTKLIKVTYDGVSSEHTPQLAGGTTNAVDASHPGAVWFTQSSTSKFCAYYPFIGGLGLAWTIPAGSNPTGILRGADNMIWVLENDTNKVRRYDINTDTSVTFTIPTAASGPRRIIDGPDGNRWFLETSVHKLARITSEGVITEYPLPNSVGDMTLGPDGNFWITEPSVGKILRFRPFFQGDVNGDSAIDVADVFYLINYLFAGGPAPK